MKPGLSRAALLLFTLVLGGCPKVPLSFGPQGEIKDPAVLLKALDERAAKFVAVQGEAKVKVKTPDQSGSVGEFIAARRPSFLHLETLNFFGKPVAVLASNAEKFSLYIEENAQFVTGPPTAGNVSRLLPIELEPAEAVELLLGQVPHLTPLAMDLAVDEKERAYVLTLRRPGLTQQIWIATDDLRPLKSRVRGAPAYDLDLSDYADHGGLKFPETIALVTVNAQGKPDGTALTVKFKDAELNGEADPALYTLEQPEGTKRVEVDAQGQPVGENAGTKVEVPALPLAPETGEPKK